MNLLLRIGRWGESHHPRWMDIIRIVLGVFLIYKGIDFLLHMGRLTHILGLTGQDFGDFAYVLAGHYVVFAHIVGGLALVLGMFTRAACIIQIPVMLGAVFFCKQQSIPVATIPRNASIHCGTAPVGLFFDSRQWPVGGKVS